ncbi:hypothetical protein ESCO_003678 [Escovopsis weberi]|uniref:LYR motif-containing protein Cup1-like N-terminal domain-containing protein n=1 Tax=Escovopsis weberi TaxID=150374 RepID=A0A0M8N0A9_ESCWE|nr:hypothetical protein ESCO_003678 [Escovopsis weberi]
MPAPAYPIPAGLSVLQLYRHLLRECSYLPPAIRSTITKTIQTPFHKHRYNDARPKAHIARARTTLRTLRAANSGDKGAMESLIFKGFGRTGSRRRELMAKLVVPQGPSNSKRLQALLDPAARQTAPKDEDDAPAMPDAPMSKKAFYEKWDQQKLLKVLQSQKQQQRESKCTASWRGSSIGSLEPDQLIPTKTIWGNPPSEILKRAKRSNWWRRNADKIMPPLGKGEWDVLQKLSEGAQEEYKWAIPGRRAHAGAQERGSESGRLAWESVWRSYAANPADVVERPKSLTHQRRSGQKDNNPYGVGDRDRTLSPRWFQRAYNRAWQLTPTMEQDPNTLRYSITWGRAGSKLPCATKLQSEIFEGVDNRGQRLPTR